MLKPHVPWLVIYPKFMHLVSRYILKTDMLCHLTKGPVIFVLWGSGMRQHYICCFHVNCCFFFSWQLIISQAWYNIGAVHTHKSVGFSSLSTVVVRHCARSSYYRENIWWLTVSEVHDHHDSRQATLALKQRLRHILRHNHEAESANQKWRLIGNGVWI